MVKINWGQRPIYFVVRIGALSPYLEGGYE